MRYLRHAAIVAFTLIVLFTAHSPAEAKDEWIQVRSKNFFLVGNASEKDIRKVGTRLEQFRETFRLLFSRANLSSSIPTNVVVFKSDSAYKPYKPKRADGKIDTQISGYFQPGEDVNYITLSTEGDDKDTFGTIFHEYVHFIIETNFGKSEVPPWFNEGLAEYYQTFEIAGDQKVKLGLPQSNHLALLQQYDLLPLEKLFAVTNYQLHQTGDHSRQIFYAESWALIHYLTHNGKSTALSKFFDALLRDTPPDKAFQDAFLTTYASMEQELRRYVSRSTYNYNEFTLKTKLVFDAEMQASPLDEADSNAYLGDLLYHTNRPDDAEPLLLNALRLKPASSMANTSLGMVKIKQRKYDEAKRYLEAAIADDAKNHSAYYRYAFLLSRENEDEMGFARKMPKETADKIREVLAKAISLNPAFTESYDLLAFVNLVTNEHLDESITAMQAALRYQPGNQRYAMRIAEILTQQSKYPEAIVIAQKIAATSDDPSTKNRAESLIMTIARKKEYDEQIAANKKYYEGANAEAVKRGRAGEMIVEDPLANMRSINAALRKPATEEKRVIGRIQKIDCKGRPLMYTIKTQAETFAVSTDDFDKLTLNAFVPEADKAQIGCDEDLSALNAVITYKPKLVPKSASRGELVSVEFVTGDFRFLEQLPRPTLPTSTGVYDSSTVSGTMAEPPPLSSAEADELRLNAMMRNINQVLRKPINGEKREMGYLDKIDCGGKVPIFVLRTSAKTFRLINSVPQNLKIGVFTKDLADMQFGCGIKPIEIPAVFIYTDKPDAKSKSDGEIISLEFVPKIFTLEP